MGVEDPSGPSYTEVLRLLTTLLCFRFHWSRIDGILGESLATAEWNITPGTLAGSYRIQHFGHFKSLGSGEIKPYSGMSSVFMVL